MPRPRTEDLRRDPGRVWTREQWGGDGRPVHLINHPSRDRSAWWPVAARLAADHAVTVLDLPGHGDPVDLAEDLAEFHARTGTRAPVVVGHAAEALVATAFAARYLAHAVVAVECRLDTAPDAARALGRNPIRCPYLSVFAAPPRGGYEDWLRARVRGARFAVYDAPGAFPHLSRVERFTGDLRAIAI